MRQRELIRIRVELPEWIFLLAHGIFIVIRKSQIKCRMSTFTIIIAVYRCPFYRLVPFTQTSACVSCHALTAGFLTLGPSFNCTTKTKLPIKR